MITEAFNTMRKNLVESVTGSALDWLAYMGTDAALAAIPDTNPPRYVVAGTLADIVKLLPATEAFTVPPLTAPAPLTDALAAVKLLRDAINKQLDPSYICVSDHPSLYAALHATERFENAAPAPQQSELTDERIEAIWNSIDGKAVITGENQMNWNSALRRAFACAIEREVAKAAPAAQVLSVTEYQVICASGDAILAGMKPGDVSYDFALVRNLGIKIDGQDVAPAAPVQTAEPKRIPDMLTVETIQGAIAFGRMGINPPPSPDHWGNEFWQIGRQLAKLGETSAWDNVTPVDVAAPVQADQAQAEQAAAVRAAEWMPIATVPMDGTEVLLYLPAPYNRVVKARWFDVWENWIEGDFPDPQDEYCGIGSQLPTHWTHLPAAPSTATSNDTGALGDTGGTK